MRNCDIVNLKNRSTQLKLFDDDDEDDDDDDVDEHEQEYYWWC